MHLTLKRGLTLFLIFCILFIFKSELTCLFFKKVINFLGSAIQDYVTMFFITITEFMILHLCNCYDTM